MKKNAFEASWNVANVCSIKIDGSLLQATKTIYIRHKTSLPRISLMVTIEIENTSDNIVNIDSAYLCAGNDWSVVTEGAEGSARPRTNYWREIKLPKKFKVDLPVSSPWSFPRNSKRKLIVHLIRGLSENEDNLASYDLNERCVVRLLTHEGNFDCEIPLKKEVEAAYDENPRKSKS